MTRNRTLTLLVLATIAVVALLSATRADAIPAFARKYQFSCSTCHAPFPRLKPFAEEFAGRGFHMEDPSKEPARATYDVGDPSLKLFRELPLAIRMDFFSSYKQDAVAEADFEWPWSLKLLSGGPISDSVSYYFYGILEQGESIKLEDTFLQFSAVLGLPVDMTIGQFQVSDPLFKRELRLERADYSIFKVRVGDSPTDLTYDRGLILTWHAPAKVDVIAEILNGNGIEPAQDDNFDDNTAKNTALRVSRWFGPVRLGALAYEGKTTLAGAENHISYLGPDLVANLGPNWQLNACFLERRDDNPYFAPSTAGLDDIVTRGGFAELLFFPKGQDGRWVLAALYNKVTSDDELVPQENASLTLNYLLARNMRFLAEAAHDFEEDTNRLTVGIVTAF